MSSNAMDIAPTVDRGAPSRFFFVAHISLLVAVFVGFAPTFYLRGLFASHPLPGILVLHGAVLTGWFVLAAAQAWLMHTRRVRWHRRVGYVAAGWAVLVVIMGLIADTRMASEINSSRDADIIVCWGNLFSLFLFGTFVTLGLVFRKRPESHKRLIVLASISIIGPALARFTEWSVFPGGMEARPIYGVGGLLMLYAALLTYDLVERRRPHPASWMGTLAMLMCSLATGLLFVSGVGFRILQYAH